jgi:L-threonylcarbamoyladenylate synthase
MHTALLPCSHPGALARALQALQSGELVAFPTDTVYGLGASLRYPASILKLYEVKGREAAKAIPILVSSSHELALVAQDLNPAALRLAERFWPGPLTVVVPRRLDLPVELSSYDTIGVRMPDHPDALALLRATGPLAVTSANVSGQPSAVTAQEVLAQLSGRIPLVLDGGACPGGVSSTVVDTTAPELRILRQGPLTLEALVAALKQDQF